MLLLIFQDMILMGMKVKFSLYSSVYTWARREAPRVAGFVGRWDFTGQGLSLEDRYMLPGLNLSWPLPGFFTPEWFPELCFGTLLKEHVFIFAHGQLSPGAAWVWLCVKFTSCECDKGGLTLFLVVMAFKMVPWAGLSSPLTGRLHPAGSGSRWPSGSCCFTCYSGSLKEAGF